MHCLICSAPINNSRLGVNSCRACAAFYKRAEGLFDQLKCSSRTEDCWERGPKTSCRKCRFVRFREVLAQASQNSTVIEITSKNVRCAEDSHAKQSSFIDHTSFYDCEPIDSDTPLLQRIRKGYSYMCVIRKCGEEAMKHERNPEREVQTENLVLTPEKYSTMVPTVKLMRKAILECANFSFDEFRELDKQSKEYVVETGLVIDVLESTYRACHHFPEDLKMRLCGYTTFIGNSDLASFLENCPDNINKEKLVEEFKQTLARLSTIVRQQFETVKPTDIEFCALFGLALWKDENVKHDETLQITAAKIRAEILKELHIYYAKRRTVDYASRLGSIFCLLMNCEDCALQFFEDFEVFRLFNMFASTLK